MSIAYGFGVDVGGTTCKMGLFDEDGKLVEKWEIPTDREHHGANILPDIAKAMQECMTRNHLQERDILGVGLGVPGPVTPDGIVHGCVNLGWGEKQIVKELEQLTGFRVAAGNDATVAALGEQRWGGGLGHDSMVLLTLGTGVGGGIVIDGKALCGYNGAGGELGHMNVNPTETTACSCGNRGCLEQYVSATGISCMANRYLQKEHPPTILSQEDTSAKAVFDAAKKSDTLALEIVEEVGEILGRALASISAGINPELFVLGGGVSRAGEILIEVTTKYYKTYAFHACKDTPIVLAQLGNDAGIYGCMGMVLSL